MPNLVVSSSQQNAAKRPEFFPAKIPNVVNAAKPQVVPYPSGKPITELRNTPAVDSSWGRSLERIVPVFASKVRTGVPRAVTHPPSSLVAPQPATAMPTDASRPSGVYKPTFTQTSGLLQKKPETAITASKPSAKTITSKAVGVAQKNVPVGVRSSKPPGNTSQSATMFHGVHSLGKMTPKCVAGHPTSAAAGRNSNTCESSFRLAGVPSSGVVRTHGTGTIAAFQNGNVHTAAAVRATSEFSVSDLVDLTLEFTASQQPASLNRRVRDEHAGTTATGCPSKASDRTECHKRKLEVGVIIYK